MAVPNRSNSPIVISIQRWHPTLLNALMRVHWRTQARMKRDDRAVVWAHCLEVGAAKATGRRRVDIELKLRPRQRRKPDPDGVWKSLLDALVCADALIDDRQEWCEQGAVTFVRGAERDWGTTITLTDLAAAKSV